MPKQADIIFKDNRFILTGELDFCNVMSVYEKSLPYIKNCSSLTFDFSRLTNSSSAGIALMVEWLKLANAEAKTVRFESLPDALMSILQAAGMNELITA